jgi:DNA-binding response OmpR family regulator
MRGRVLLADDEKNIREFMELHLLQNGYEVVTAADGREAWRKIEENGDFDCALLDIMMPEIDGYALCKKIVQRGAGTGVIFLTARTEEADKVKGFLLGADDYITKPFSPYELMARVAAVIRRVQRTGAGDPPRTLRSGAFLLDPHARKLQKGDKLAELTNIELSLMEFFFQNNGVTVTRQRILETVWQDEKVADIKIVDVNIRRLRLKIEDNPSDPRFLVTMWGEGYKWQGEAV